MPMTHNGGGAAHTPAAGRTPAGHTSAGHTPATHMPALPSLTLALASQSPARLATLRAAGVEPLVQVSHVDEDALLARVHGGPSQGVLALAAAKARDVAATPGPAQGADFVVGCDSMFEFEGEVYGKPHSPEVARERLARMSGHSGILHTGHCLVHVPSGRSLAGISRAKVTFAHLSAAEIEAYIATGEPLEVAGSFTADGLGGPFIDRLEGDYHGVVGISLPLLRSLVEHLGLSFTQFWAKPARPALGVLPEAAQRFLADSHHGTVHHGADGFLLCGCGKRHWGMNGAAGIAAFRRHAGRIQILLQHRSPWSHGGATWAFPGGAREWDEEPWEGALREFTEETALAPTDLRRGGELTTAHVDWSYTSFVARCRDGLEAVADGESMELRWVNVEDVTSYPLLPSFAATWPQVRELARTTLDWSDGASN